MGIFDYNQSENFNAAEIAEEREHLAETIKAIKAQIAAFERDDFEYRMVDFYDDEAVAQLKDEKFRHDEMLLALRILKDSLSTPYFARMRLRPKSDEVKLDEPSMVKSRRLVLSSDTTEHDIYVGAHMLVCDGRIIVFSHNSPIGNKVYDRFENGVIEVNGYKYEVAFRRKFDISGGELKAVFQDYSEESGGVVYDKFLAHMLEKRRGDRRLVAIIPTIQANQNEIITRPATENTVTRGAAGSGKTMIMLQRLEYLAFNKKLDPQNAVIIAPSERYKAHISPVVDDLMLGGVKMLTMPELYKTLLLSMKLRASEKKLISTCTLIDDDDEQSYSDKVKRTLITGLEPIKRAYAQRMAEYRVEKERYEQAAVWDSTAIKPVPPKAPALSKTVGISGGSIKKCKLYLLLSAYCYVLGTPDFSSALFIDEGQDYYYNEYKLLSQVTKAIFNVYGDENQQLVKGRGIDDFNKLSALRSNFCYYSLNENYRNAREITDFVNNELDMSVTALGLSGGQIRSIKVSELSAELKNRGDARVAVVYSKADKEAERVAHSSGATEKDIYTVSQVKGMEFERVYVIGELSRREKYVAFTRALVDLIIVADN